MPPRAPDLKKHDAAAYEKAVKTIRDWVDDYSPTKMKTMLPAQKKRATDARLEAVSAVIPRSWPGNVALFVRVQTVRVRQEIGHELLKNSTLGSAGDVRSDYSATDKSCKARMKDARERYKEDPEAMEEDDPDLALRVTSSYEFQLRKAKELYKKDPTALENNHPALFSILTSLPEFQLKKAKELRRSAMAGPVFLLLLPYLDKGLHKAWNQYFTKKQEMYRRQLVMAALLCVTKARF